MQRGDLGQGNTVSHWIYLCSTAADTDVCRDGLECTKQPVDKVLKHALRIQDKLRAQAAQINSCCPRKMLHEARMVYVGMVLQHEGQLLPQRAKEDGV